ncbi:MAG: hypothetical protein ACI4W6_02635 [Acutalibacteraceae bacterium]
MDNETKLTDEQIKKLISDFKKTTADGQTDVDAFTKSHLTKSQAAAFKKLLSNPQLIKTILASDKAKQILQQLKDSEEEQ